MINTSIFLPPVPSPRSARGTRQTPDTRTEQSFLPPMSAPPTASATTALRPQPTPPRHIDIHYARRRYDISFLGATLTEYAGVGKEGNKQTTPHSSHDNNKHRTLVSSSNTGGQKRGPVCVNDRGINVPTPVAESNNTILQLEDNNIKQQKEQRDSASSEEERVIQHPPEIEASRGVVFGSTDIDVVSTGYQPQKQHHPINNQLLPSSDATVTDTMIPVSQVQDAIYQSHINTKSSCNNLSNTCHQLLAHYALPGSANKVSEDGTNNGVGGSVVAVGIPPILGATSPVPLRDRLLDAARSLHTTAQREKRSILELCRTQLPEEIVKEAGLDRAATEALPPASRCEVLALAEATELLLQHATRQNDQLRVQGIPLTAEDRRQEAEAVISAVDAVLSELVRQVMVGCTERGLLLQYVREQFFQYSAGLVQQRVRYDEEERRVQEALTAKRAQLADVSNELEEMQRHIEVLKGENIRLGRINMMMSLQKAREAVLHRAIALGSNKPIDRGAIIDAVLRATQEMKQTDCQVTRERRSIQRNRRSTGTRSINTFHERIANDSENRSRVSFSSSSGPLRRRGMRSAVDDIQDVDGTVDNNLVVGGDFSEHSSDDDYDYTIVASVAAQTGDDEGRTEQECNTDVDLAQMTQLMELHQQHEEGVASGEENVDGESGNIAGEKQNENNETTVADGNQEGRCDSTPFMDGTGCVDVGVGTDAELTMMGMQEQGTDVVSPETLGLFCSVEVQTDESSTMNTHININRKDEDYISYSQGGKYTNDSLSETVEGDNTQHENSGDKQGNDDNTTFDEAEGESLSEATAVSKAFRRGGAFTNTLMVDHSVQCVLRPPIANCKETQTDSSGGGMGHGSPGHGNRLWSIVQQRRSKFRSSVASTNSGSPHVIFDGEEGNNSSNVNGMEPPMNIALLAQQLPWRDAGKCRALSWLFTVLSDIHNAPPVSSTTGDAPGISSLTGDSGVTALSVSAVSYFRNKFGISKVSDRYIGDFIKTLAKHAPIHRRAFIFAQFACLSRPMSLPHLELSFDDTSHKLYLHLIHGYRRVVPTAGAKVMQDAISPVPQVSVAQVVAILDVVLGKYLLPVAMNALRIGLFVCLFRTPAVVPTGRGQIDSKSTSYMTPTRHSNNILPTPPTTRSPREFPLSPRGRGGMRPHRQQKHALVVSASGVTPATQTPKGSKPSESPSPDGRPPAAHPEDPEADTPSSNDNTPVSNNTNAPSSGTTTTHTSIGNELRTADLFIPDVIPDPGPELSAAIDTTLPSTLEAALALGSTNSSTAGETPSSAPMGPDSKVGCLDTFLQALSAGTSDVVQPLLEWSRAHDGSMESPPWLS